MDKGKKAVLLIHAMREVVEEKRLIVLERQMNYHNCITGKILLKSKTFDTIELPDKQNQRNISCIPKGVYTWQKVKRTSNGKDALYIRDVEGRSQILIHQGTKPSHTQGCILVPNYQELHDVLNKKGLIVII
ncbi:MAG: DUF5675 family protein [Bacteroidia bacterium]